MHSSDCVSVHVCTSLTGQYHWPILAYHRYICYLTELIWNFLLFRNYNAERKRFLGQIIIIIFPVYCLLFNCKSSLFNTCVWSPHFRDRCNKCGYIVRCINIGTLFSLILVLLQKPSIGRVLVCACVCVASLHPTLSISRLGGHCSVPDPEFLPHPIHTLLPLPSPPFPPQDRRPHGRGTGWGLH